MLRNRPISYALLAFLLFVTPVLGAAAWLRVDQVQHWSRTRWDSAGLLPAPDAHPEALVRVLAARAWGWKGAVAVHSWIVFKEANAPAYERYEVVGWGVRRGAPAVRRNLRPPDGYWAGSPPRVVAALDGEAAAAAIPRIREAIAAYPYPDVYRTWPGPNSNSFVAWIVRRVPELRAELPALAIGKDWLGNGLVAGAASGSGYQLSLFGVFGLTLAVEEGLEVNVLGLVLGLDFKDLAIKLPGLGRLGLRGD